MVHRSTIAIVGIEGFEPTMPVKATDLQSAERPVAQYSQFTFFLVEENVITLSVPPLGIEPSPTP